MQIFLQNYYHSQWEMLNFKEIALIPYSNLHRHEYMFLRVIHSLSHSQPLLLETQFFIIR